MLTWVTVGRNSHLSLRGCLALQQYFFAHGRVNHLTHQMTPVAYSLQQKHLCRCRDLNPGCSRPNWTCYHYTIQAPFCTSDNLTTLFPLHGTRNFFPPSLSSFRCRAVTDKLAFVRCRRRRRREFKSFCTSSSCRQLVVGPPAYSFERLKGATFRFVFLLCK
jgi:hypothetical protein